MARREIIKGILSLSLLFAAACAKGEPVVEAFGELASSTIDQHGDTIGGIGSGIIYDASKDVYLCVSDRGPGDGTLPYRPRYVTIKITQADGTLSIKLLDSVLFKDEKGRFMTGLIPDDVTASAPRMRDGRTCIDPEAIALAPDGTIYVTDEYGPFLYQFQRDGTFIRCISLPEKFWPRTADGKVNFAGDAQLISGRNVNQGPEGMCILPDGKTVALAFQSGLMEMGGRQSSSTLLLLLDLATGAPKALYSYPFATEIPGSGDKKSFDMDNHREVTIANKDVIPQKDLSVNDICSISDTRFLVLEREGSGRNGAKRFPTARYKAVWVADCGSATNLLTDKTSPPTPVTKSLLFNLPDLVTDRRRLAAKWEGIAIIPPSNKEEITLIMSADNDFLSPVIREEGREYPFPRAEDAVGSQFFKIRAPLTKEP